MRFPAPDTATLARSLANERESATFTRYRARICRSRAESTGRESEKAGEHVRSFCDSCFEFATRRATACRKGGKKLPCRRARPRVGCGYTVCPRVPLATSYYRLLSWRMSETTHDTKRRRGMKRNVSRGMKARAGTEQQDDERGMKGVAERR